jgi:tetrahydromethanopterin S-methyltransferase subunit B
MKLAKPLTVALALLPALAHAHPGHAAFPGHQHAAGFLESPAFGFVAGGIVVAVLLVARALPRRIRSTATKRR